jgi:hypothetical protein
MPSAAVQVPVSFSPAKHRSTLIDSEVLPGASRNKVLQGTSDTPAALSTLPDRLARPLKQRPTVSTAAKQPKGRAVQAAGKAGAAKGDAAEGTAAAADAVSYTIYQSDFASTAAAASTHMLTHSPTRVAAARRILESSSEWAELNKLQGIEAQQQVGVASVCFLHVCACTTVLRGCSAVHSTCVCYAAFVIRSATFFMVTP